MDVIKYILANYWNVILIGLFFIASFILQLVKKRPVEILPTIKELIYQLVPEAINIYEKLYGFGNGAEKKKSAIRFVMDAILRIYSLNDGQINAYKTFISSYIESVLSTPQKK